MQTKMSASMYKVIYAKLLKLETETCDNLCCACLNTCDTGVTIDNEINLILESGTEVNKRLSEILDYLIGKTFYNISTVFKTICNNCIDIAATSYYFILNSLEKSETLFKAIENIENSCIEIPDAQSEYKSLYLFIYTDNVKEQSVIRKHWDTEAHVNKNSVFQRIQSLTATTNPQVKELNTKCYSKKKDYKEECQKIFKIESLSCVVNEDMSKMASKLKQNQLFGIESFDPFEETHWSDEDLNSNNCELLKQPLAENAEKFCNNENTILNNLVEDKIKSLIENQDPDSKEAQLKKERLEKFRSRLFARSLKSYKCTKCNAGFDSNEQLQMHLQRKTSCTKGKGTYICDHCGYTALYKHTIRAHISTKHMGGGILCEECGVSFLNESVLKIHKIRHSNIRNYECKVCKGKYKTAYYLKMHMFTHSSLLKYECELCHKKFNTSAKRFSHTKHHHAQQSVPCEICKKIFKSELTLYSHIMKMHKKKDGAAPNFLCNQCNYRTYTEKGLERHIISKHNSLKKDEETVSYKESFYKVQYVDNLMKYECTQCGHQANTIKMLEEHINFKHKGERPFSCGDCGKNFGTSRVLQNHVKTVHNENNIYKCNICNREYKSLSGLHNHMPSHTGTKAYRCEFCGTFFSTTSKRFDHVMRYHGSEMFECDICQKKYRTQDKLDTHKSLHAKGIISAYRRTKKRYPCEHCGHLSTTRKELDEHINYKHKGEKPFVCDTCGKTFGTKRLLVVHAKSHAERSFDCNMCDNKSFKTALGLKLHKLSHTGETPYRCKYCESWFKCPSRRLVHERRQHPEMFPIELLARVAEKDKKRRIRNLHPCDLCGHRAKTKKKLEDHVKFKHHDVRLSDYNESGDTFGTERQVKDHLIKYIKKEEIDESNPLIK